MHLVGEGLAQILQHLRLVEIGDAPQILGIQLGIEFDALVLLLGLQDFLEQGVLHAQHDVRIHLDEAAIAVIGEARIAGELGQARDRGFGEAEIEDGVHHPGHGDPRARAHRDQQRIFRIAQPGAGATGHLFQRRLDGRLQVVRIGFAMGGVIGADLGGDGEAGRHRQAQIAHLGQVRALAAEQILHLRAAFRAAVTEGIDPLRHVQIRILQPNVVAGGGRHLGRPKTTKSRGSCQTAIGSGNGPGRPRREKMGAGSGRPEFFQKNAFAPLKRDAANPIWAISTQLRADGRDGKFRRGNVLRHSPPSP